MEQQEFCDACAKPSGSFHQQNDRWVCHFCYVRPPDRDTCRLFEMGHENPLDPKGSTAHVRDIKARRIDPKTKAVFNYEAPRTYFFPK